MIYQLLEPAVKAFDRLEQFETNGTIMNPDTYYQIILDITNDEVAARKSQAELMLMQMPD